MNLNLAAYIQYRSLKPRVGADLAALSKRRATPSRRLQAVEQVCAYIRAAALGACVALSSATHAVVGSPGTLDATFNYQGKVATLIGLDSALAAAVALQSDGKIVIAGGCGRDAIRIDFCALRYLPNGALDPSFNTNGTVQTILGVRDSEARAVAVQPDGKIVLAGFCEISMNRPAFCAVRYHPNGDLDLGFNGTGKVTTTIGLTGDEARAMALQPDGKIVLAGACHGDGGHDFCAARYHANGTLDRGFNSIGKVITPVGTLYDSANALALQPDGKLVVAGVCGTTGAATGFCALRYHANGTLDAGFKKGITEFDGLSSSAKGLALQPDGHVVLAGDCSNSTRGYFCAMRLATNGTIDASFNQTGTVVTAVGSPRDTAYGLALEPDGKLLLVGGCESAMSAATVICAIRHHSNGGLDTSFNETGRVFFESNGPELAQAVALQPDGKTVIVGFCNNGTNTRFCAIRIDGGPFGYQNCRPDVDGDGALLASNDVLIYARVALGFTGAAVVNGVSFANHATRKTWPLIRDYLVTQCGMSLVPD